MSKIAVVISELAHYAPGEIAAISPQDLIKQSKTLQAHKWAEREVSTALSQAALGNSSWHKWVKQVKVTGKKRAYYYLPNSTQPQLTATGKLVRVPKRRLVN